MFISGDTHKIQARKKSTKINFFGPETAGWGGGLPPERVGVEKFVPSLESLSSLGFEGNLGWPGNFAGMSRTPEDVQKLRAKKFVRIFHSLKMCSQDMADSHEACAAFVWRKAFLRNATKRDWFQ